MSQKNSDEMTKIKRETFTVQIRKQKREDIFKLKRVLPTIKHQDFESLQLQHLLNDPKKCSQYVASLIQETQKLYSDLPQSRDDIYNRFMRLKIIQQDQQELISKIFIEEEFPRFLALFLNEKFMYMENLQEMAGTMLANFLGTMQRNDEVLNQWYFQFLDMMSRDFLINFKKLILSPSPKIVEMALYCFGNMIHDNFELYESFELDDGFEILLNLAMNSNQSDLMLWILWQSFYCNSNSKTVQKNCKLLPFIDKMIIQYHQQNQQESLNKCLDIIAWMSDREEYPEYIIRMNSFQNILSIMKQNNNQHMQSIDIVCNLCWMEPLQTIILKQDIIDTMSLQLSSFNTNIKISILYGLEQMVQGQSDKIKQAIINHPSLIDKIIAIGYQVNHKLAYAVALFLESFLEKVEQLNLIIQKDHNYIYLEKLVDRNLISLIGQLLNHQRITIEKIVLTLMKKLGELNEKYTIGYENKRSSIIVAMESKQLFERLSQLSESHYDDQIKLQADDVVEQFLKMLE